MLLPASLAIGSVLSSGVRVWMEPHHGQSPGDTDTTASILPSLLPVQRTLSPTHCQDLQGPQTHFCSPSALIPEALHFGTRPQPPGWVLLPLDHSPHCLSQLAPRQRGLWWGLRGRHRTRQTHLPWVAWWRCWLFWDL